MPVYWLGSSIGQLFSQLTIPNVKMSTILPLFTNARNNLGYFVALEQALPLSAKSAKEILEHIDRIVTPERLQNPDFPFPKEDLDFLGINIFSFQALLGAELAQTNIFHVTPKRAFDMTALINRGETIFSSTVLGSVRESIEDFIRDIREATKSLAFDMPTAVGFHLFRAIETLITREYFPGLGIDEKDWGRNRNMGHYITILEGHGVDDKITSILRHLKNHYRNPVTHPEEFWTDEMADNALGLTVSVVTLIVTDINTRGSGILPLIESSTT